jgi:hypothetical protein
MKGSEVQDFAGEIQTGQGPRPRWLTILGYFLVLWGLGYLIFTIRDGGLDGPNRIIWVLLAIWLIYTPLAARKKWFAIGL